MAEQQPTKEKVSSPVGRGGAGTYIEGELGAFYLLQMLAGAEARGLPHARIERIEFQGADKGYALDDLIIHGQSAEGNSVLEIQSKRTITFAPKDPVFAEVCGQIVRSKPESSSLERHLFAVATQRTSAAISGPYQDVLRWAETCGSGAQFFARLASKGVAGQAMRDFANTLRTNLVAGGVEDDDEIIWNYIRRFLILEFDFEASAPLARTHAQSIARQVLAAEDIARAPGLWSALIETSIKTGKTGGSLDLEQLRKTIGDLGFRLAGSRDFAPARARLAEMSRFALAEIGSTIAGVNLPRQRVLAALDEARQAHRFIEISGGPGSGKSAIMRQAAERQAREANILVLDPIGTPEGGWTELATRLGVSGTAKDFLADIAASGGGTLFIDSLEMFTSPGRQRTVNDILREVARIDGFAVIVTAREGYDDVGASWLAEDALATLGKVRKVKVGDLDDQEVAVLVEQAPQLRALLDPDHPAARIARNPYRLSQLLKVPSAIEIRTEAALAAHWWKTADNARQQDVRTAQRMIAQLADAALLGNELTEFRTDPPARSHLLSMQTLSEPRRDHFVFHHDVLRDWAIGCRLHEDPGLLDTVDLAQSPSPRIARGIEFAGRLALENEQDSAAWLALLTSLSRTGAHPAWRRLGCMALLRSEVAADLLARCSDSLLGDGGALLIELGTAVAAVDTISAADLFAGPVEEAGITAPIPKSLRVAASTSAPTLLKWCIENASDIPLQAIGTIVKLVEIQALVLMVSPAYARATAKMLFEWLLQLDVRRVVNEIPSPPDRPQRQSYTRLVEDVRDTALLLAAHAPELAKSYLREIAAENDTYKVKAIRPHSNVLAGVAPQELAALIETSLIEPGQGGRSWKRKRDRALSFADSDYLPPSPAQPPFLPLLEAEPATGLALIRKLVDEAVDFYSRGEEPRGDGFTLAFATGPRFFPWTGTLFWARDQAREYSAASGLMALEAWAHDRLDRGDDVELVLDDILGPEGSCAAYILVAIDVLLSHWPGTRDALVPIIACPALLATDRSRPLNDQLGRMTFGEKEPTGRVQLADLAKRASRRVTLEQLLPYYLGDDDAARRLRALLGDAVAALGPYHEQANFGDPAFMASYAANILERTNWVERDGGIAYQSPPAEAKHLADLEARRLVFAQSTEIEAKIRLAIDDPAKGSPEVASEAMTYARGALPDYSDTDVLKSRSTRLIATAMLVARDGDEALLAAQEEWIRAVAAIALEEENERFKAHGMLAHNRPAMALCTLAFLWQRHQLVADRDALISAASRSDRIAIPAFVAAAGAIAATDPRIVKAAVRVAFSVSRWRWQPRDEDDAEREEYEAIKESIRTEAVAAEVAWLDGGQEPAWPTLPVARPALDRRSRQRIKPDEGLETDDEDGLAAASEAPSLHVDHHALSEWLALLNHGEVPSWSGELVDCYALWSARLNGLGLAGDVEFDRPPTDWNLQFYVLVARAMLDAPDERFNELVELIEGMPDQSFCDVAENLIGAADVLYFNEAERTSDRPATLRERLVGRTLKLARWNSIARPGELRIDREIGPVIAKLFMNWHSSFSSTRSYLVPAVFDRVDPLLLPLQPLLPSGPTPFIALCTMNLLLVAPRARHLNFFLRAVEAWMAGAHTVASTWIELGIGRKIIEWLQAASQEDPGILQAGHVDRSRIDAVLGYLVSHGVSEAHELEVQIQTLRLLN